MGKTRLEVMIPEELLRLIWEERDKAGYEKTGAFVQNLISIGLVQWKKNKEEEEHNE